MTDEERLDEDGLQDKQSPGKNAKLDEGGKNDQKGRRKGLMTNPLIHRLLKQSLRIQWKRYLIAIIAMIVAAATTSGTAFILRDIVDAITIPEKRPYVMIVAVSVAAIFTLKGVANYIQTVMLARAGLNIAAQQQAAVYDKLLRQGIAFFGTQDSSTIITRVNRGAAASRNITQLLLTGYVRDILTVLGLVGVMVYRQPVLSAIALIAAPLAMFGIRKLLEASRKSAASELAAAGEVIRILQETSAGVRVIKAFSLEGAMTIRMAQAISRVESRAYKFSKLQGMTSPIMDTLSGLAIAAIVILSSVNAFGLGKTTSGELMSFLTALLMAYDPAKRIMRTRLQIDRYLVALKQMFIIMDAPETMKEAEDAVPLPEGPGEIRLNNISFAFKKNQILTDVSHVFEAHKMTALVGPSGGGKSTMINLIMRLYDPSVGNITIDGMDIRQATFQSLRNKMSLVSQDIFLFSSSIRDNIRAGRADATDDEVEDAAKVAHAHEFIMELPDGYDTLVGQNGAFLSGGQKQRLSIARAVVRRSAILLLDEATSALDATSERLVRDAIDKISHQVTMIVIAHRFSTILNADTICYIENGTIVESGSLNELLEQNGAFRRLYDEQYQDQARLGT